MNPTKILHHHNEAIRLRELADLHSKIAAAYDAGVHATISKVESHICIAGTCRHPGKKLSRATERRNRYIEEEIIPELRRLPIEPGTDDDLPF